MRRARSKHGPGKQGGDGLTDQQRRYAHARADHPDWTQVRCAEHAGIANPASKANRLEKLTAVRLVVAARTRDPKTGKTPAVTKEWVRAEMQKIYMDSRTPLNEKVKLLDKLGATVEGYYVPVGVKHSGKVGLEDVIEAMGGRPKDLTESDEETIQ